MTTLPVAGSPGRGRLVPRPTGRPGTILGMPAAPFTTAVISLAIACAVLMASSGLWPVAYQLSRQLALWRLDRQLIDWPSRESEHFVVKYRPEDETTAPIVLEAAEKAYSIVTQEADFIPRGKTLVAIYPTAEELNAAFGWSAQESAQGVYWGGAIRVLSPKAWIGDVSYAQLKEIFWAAGPMVHEFTHLILDYKTAGNYPRWFSEGLAQYLELKYCGAVLSSSSDLCLQRLYSLQDLGDFSQLDDELLAYEQALSLVECLTDIYGPEIIDKIVTGLAQGQTFTRSLRTAGIPSLAALEEDWHQWLKSPAGVSAL